MRQNECKQANELKFCKFNGMKVKRIKEGTFANLIKRK